MAKTFLTNINLKGNQLLNAVIHSASSAPSALAAGQLYYNTGDSTFYYSTGTGTNNWAPVGVQYISSVGSNLSVVDGQLDISSDPVFNTVEASQNGAGENFKVGDDVWIGDINVSNTMNVRGIEDTSVGYISFGSNTDSNKIGTNPDGDLLVSSNNNNVILYADGNVYINSPANANNRVATIGDINNDAIITSVESTQLQINAGKLSLTNNVTVADRLTIGGQDFGDAGTLQVANQNGQNMLVVDTAASPMEQYHGYNNYTSATGVININSFVNLSSEGNAPTGFLFVNSNTTTHPVPALHLESAGDLALRAGADTGSGNIILYTGTTSGGTDGKVFIGWNQDQGQNQWNQVATLGDINNASYITSVDSTNFNVSSNELFLNSEIEVQKTSYWRDGTQQGVIAAQSDSSLRLTAITGELQLESNGGNVRINPSSTITWFNNNIYINADSGIIGTDNNSLHLNADNGVITTDTAEFHTPKIELWNGGDTSGSRLGLILAHPSDGSLSVVASNQMVLEAHSGDITLVPSTGSAYIGSVSDSNKIATIGDVHAAAQGLSVLEPVITAAGANIDITIPVTTLIGGLELNNGNRVLLNAQATATENGIYVFNGSSNTLERSTNAEDAALKEGSYTLVTEGTYAAQGYIVTATPYTNATIWTQFSAAGEYTFNGGLYQNGTTVAVDYESLESQLVTDGFALASDYSSVTRKYSHQIVGDDTTNTYVITHGLNTQDIVVRVWDSKSSSLTFGQDVEVDVVRSASNANVVTINFASNVSSSEAYSVVVIG